MSCRSKGNHHPRARASRRGQRQASRVSILEPGSKLSWQKECRRSLSRSRIANTDHCRVAISAAHSSKFTRSLGMPARAQKRSRYAYVQGRWRSATIGKIQEAVALTSATEMAGYNHSNPQRVVYHATYPTPLAPSESLRFFRTTRIRRIYSDRRIYTLQLDDEELRAWCCDCIFILNISLSSRYLNDTILDTFMVMISFFFLLFLASALALKYCCFFQFPYRYAGC